MKTVIADINWPEVVRNIVNERDAAAFKLLFNHFYEPLLSFSVTITKDRAASEDVLADLMMTIWTVPEKLLTVRNLKTYLYISVKNRSLNVLAKEQTKAAHVYSLTHQPQSSWTPEDQLLGKELSRQLDEAILNLPAKTRMAYLLVRDSECSYAEAAEIMEISTKTVDRHIQIALRKIRASIDF